ncbi:MAG: glycosyl hydrolase family 28-related protein, partial [Bacteroidota bacterium]
MKYPILFLVVSLMLNGLFAQDVTQKTMIGLRNNTPAALSDKTFYVTDPGRQGSFVYDPSDKKTADDSVMTLVTAEGLRFKRVTDQNMVNVRWFGATGNGSTDDWYAIQKAINYLLTSTTAGRTLYFPSGTYKISQPLMIARLDKTGYSQVSINLQGPANAKDLAVGLACIAPSFNNTFAIGVQLGKGVLI